MKALRTKICTYAIALLGCIGFASPSLAGSSDFAGIFIAGHAEMNVVAIPGTHTAGADNNNDSSSLGSPGGTENVEVTNGTIGAMTPTAGYEVGFNLPLGDVFFVTMGYADGGGKKAALAKVRDQNNTSDVAVLASNPDWFYIAPSVSIFDNSAVYFKYGRSHVNLETVGDVTGSLSGIDGDMWGIGTTSIAANGLFFKTEAGAVLYDEFKLTGVGGDTNTVVEGEPVVGYGHVSIGYKF